MVFGSRSVLLGILLIKTLPSKCISQIKLDINKIKKKNTEKCVLKRMKKEEEKVEDERRDKARETFTTERLVAARRWQSREKR